MSKMQYSTGLSNSNTQWAEIKKLGPSRGREIFNIYYELLHILNLKMS